MGEPNGKAQRVAGTFVFMIGAGLILDRHALWSGLVVMLIGAAALVWGTVQGRLPLGVGAATDLGENRPAPRPTESQP